MKYCFAGNRGFSLVELLMVIAVISLLAAIAIPIYIGFQNRARQSTMISAGNKAIPELQFWLQASGSASSTNRFVDTNFDGRIDAGDMTNGELSSAGVATTYIDGRNLRLKEKSPWDSSRSLWDDGTDPRGRISLRATSKTMIRISARDNVGSILFDGVASTD